MDRCSIWTATVLLILLAAPARDSAGAPEEPGDPQPALDATSWQGVREHVLPTKAERAWCTLPWRASLWDAVIDANREAKPILLWAMNGHPLACT